MTERITREPAVVPLGSPRRARVAGAVLVGLAAVAAVVVAAVPRIPQDVAYHRFADTRVIAGVPSFWNVVSNVGFLVVGVIGLAWLARWGRPRPTGPLIAGWETATVAMLLVGILFTGAGSAYYHLAPDNTRLVWDRLPMTVVFTALFALVIGERVDARAGRLLAVPLILIGVGSVVAWHLSELAGRGDLRLYALVQLVPALAVPLVLLLCPARFTGAAWLWTALALYLAAKAFELADARVFAHAVVSGHTLKHVVSAGATACLLGMLATRRPR